MPRLFVLCGLAFSGKTTLRRELVRRTGCAWIGLDEINAERGLHGGDGVSVEEWARTLEQAVERLEELLRRGEQDVVVDDTACFRWIRERMRDVARRHGYQASLVVLDPPIEEVERRRSAADLGSDRRGIRDEVFEEHLRTFERPGGDEGAVVLRDADEVVAWLDSVAGSPLRERGKEGA